MGSKAKAWTAKQLKAIEILATEPDKTPEDIAIELHCSAETIRKWNRTPAFIDSVVMRAREYLKKRLSKVYKVLGEKAETGSPAHLKLLLDHQEKLEEMRAKVADGMITFSWRIPERDEEEVPVVEEEDKEE